MYKSIVFDLGGVMIDFDPRGYLVAVSYTHLFVFGNVLPPKEDLPDGRGLFYTLRPCFVCRTALCTWPVCRVKKGKR